MKHLLTSALLLLATFTFAQTISIQGVLRDENKRAVDDGFYEVTFNIYAAATDGEALWTDTYGSLQVRNGVFQANLGENISLETLRFDQTYYVGVKVEDRKEMTPRIALTTFPYAMAINGHKNKFPSSGNVVISEDSLVLTEGILKLEGPNGSISFNDGTSLNTANFSGPAGSLANPSTVIIKADQDGTGDDGNISIQSDDDVHMTILDNGNVGIGTIDPVAKMHLKTSLLPNLYLENSTKDITFPENATLQIGHYDPTSDTFTERMQIDEDGNVGIGSRSPKAKLHIVSKSTLPGLYFDGGTRDIAYPAGQTLQFGSYNSVDSTFELGFYLNTTGATVVTDGSSNFDYVDGRGDLFVGDDLEVDGAIYLSGNLVDANNDLFLINPSGTSEMNSLDVDNLDVNDLDVDKSIGIGVTGTVAKLHIKGSDSPLLYLEDGTMDITFPIDERLQIGAYDISNSTFTERLRIDSDGHVGIGITSPAAPLHVKSGTNDHEVYAEYNGYNTSSYESEDWTSTNSLGIQDTKTFENASAIFNNDILVDGVIAAIRDVISSDERIKNISGISNGSQDLALLNAIEITDYTMKDPVKHGNGKFKKVIAQQVYNVLPEAISLKSDLIPDIMAMSKASINGETIKLSMESNHNLKRGDFVKLITEKEQLNKVEVLEVKNKKTFTVAKFNNPEEVFVYGKWVDDFHVVDYDAIAMLNVSATQELYRKIEALEKENTLLKNTVTNLEQKADKNAVLEARLSAIEKLLQLTTEEENLVGQNNE
jgi:hypothetical protein